MEEKQKDVELRSEEVQEVMGKIPPAIVRYGISVLLVIVLLLLGGSALFSYPDTVEAAFTLTCQNPPASINAPRDGRIEKLWVTNGQHVRQGDALGVLANVANTEEVFFLRERIREWKERGSRVELAGELFFHRIPELGQIQNAYSSCLLAWNQYLQHMAKDPLYEAELVNAIATLNNALGEWESNHLLTTPIDGTVAFMQLWRENQLASNGETVFTVIPEHSGSPLGKAFLPMDGIGKVQVGQRAIVRLPAFPEQEYGFIEGKVESISPVPDANGNYVLEISFPHHLRTHQGKVLPMVKSIDGTVSIVTKERSLLQRLLNMGDR